MFCDDDVPRSGLGDDERAALPPAGTLSEYCAGFECQDLAFRFNVEGFGLTGLAFEADDCGIQGL